MTKPNGTALKLSLVQQRHLLELAAARDEGSTGTAFWRPTGANEFRTAEALARRGLLHRDFSNLSGGSAFELTEAGYLAVRS